MPALATHSSPWLGVVILAAGRSRRMGQPKLLLPWGRSSVLGAVLARWAELRPGQVGVVRAGDDGVVNAELDRLRFPAQNRIVNPTPDLGMFSSVQAAARWTQWHSGLTHWALVLADQPQLRRETLEAVIELSRRNPACICQPKFESHRRHPVILPRATFVELATTKAATLKEFLEGKLAKYCELEDPGLALDLDRPEDYTAAVRRYPEG